MTDTVSRRKRSEIMSKIRSSDTKAEIALRRCLWNEGIRFRLRPKLPGKTDIVFPSMRVVIFVDGCFWHKCPKHFRGPKSKIDYWEPKIARNVTRDKKISRALRKNGWKVLRFWEHDVNKDLEKCRKRTHAALTHKTD